MIEQKANGARLLTEHDARAGRILTQAELRERSIAGAASARHRAETSPSVRQNSTGTPSRSAIALFRQGQQRPDTRARRGPWDARSTEPAVGSVNASFTFHFPKAYRSDKPEPMPKGRGLLAAAVGRKKPGEPRDLVITNPAALAEAHRHAPMREVIQKSIGVVRDHQKGTIERGHTRGLIPEGTRPGLINRAYKHAALLALHKAGLGDYDFHMDPAAKKEFEPLTGFMRYAHRRVFDKLNTEGLKGRWQPFREEFGQLHVQRKFGKETGVRRMRMRPNDRFVKIEIGDDEMLEKAFQSVVDNRLGSDSMERIEKVMHADRIGNKSGRNTHLDRASVMLQRAIAAHRVGLGVSGTRPIPESPGGDYPHPHDANLHIKDAAKAVERHFGVRVGRGASEAPHGAVQKWAESRPESGQIGDPELAKLDLGFTLGSGPAGYNTSPQQQLHRAIHPRLRRHAIRLRLNTQRDLHRVLSGGVTRQERWQLGATTRFPRDPFAVSKRSPVDDYADRAAEPTDAQAIAGNYRMGHVRVAGHDVTIETPRGRMRRKVGAGGKRWQVRMPAHYGYIKRTEGADGDHLDVYLGPHAHQAERHPVFVVDQQHADTRRFDEHKAMLGFRDKDHATSIYDRAFSDRRGPDRRRTVHEIDHDQFRDWVRNGDTKRAFAGQLKKGIVGNAIRYGTGFAMHARAASLMGAKKLGATVAGTRIAQGGLAGARAIAQKPKIAPLWHQASLHGKRGILAPGNLAGRVAGQAIGGARGAKIGGRLGFAVDYAPEVYGYGTAAGAFGDHGEQQQAERRLRQGTAVQRGIGSVLGKSISSVAGRGAKGLLGVMHAALEGRSTATKVGLGAAGGIEAYRHRNVLADHPAARAALGAGLAGGAVALASHGRALGAARRASRAIYMQGVKQATREHLRVLEGGAPSPDHIRQAAMVRRTLKTAALRQAKTARASAIAGIRAPKKTIAGAAAAGALAGTQINPRSANPSP